MAYDYDLNLIDPALAVVAAAWPETVANGIYELDDVARTSFEENAFPYAVWDMPPAETGEWGLANAAFEPVLELHYVTKESTSTAALRGKLESLKSAMLQTNFTGCTLLDVEEVDWSGSHPANQVFLMKNVPFRAGMISFRFVAGETYY